MDEKTYQDNGNNRSTNTVRGGMHDISRDFFNLTYKRALNFRHRTVTQQAAVEVTMLLNPQRYDQAVGAATRLVFRYTRHMAIPGSNNLQIAHIQVATDTTSHEAEIADKFFFGEHTDSLSDHLQLNWEYKEGKLEPGDRGGEKVGLQRHAEGRQLVMVPDRPDNGGEEDQSTQNHG
ncbi:uncharacterized protein YALI1_E00019g [Yarrowia lipolytica]|uniref:Uncharacterized protein n=1 Tax=Yarrowia lipolytica TaxID=4952 RepID=A0A1D8NGH1_YARLL|nr:hypothetical protein YALI1_E00019g [Yarrowia lipolytica]